MGYEVASVNNVLSIIMNSFEHNHHHQDHSHDLFGVTGSLYAGTGLRIRLEEIPHKWSKFSFFKKRFLIALSCD